MEIAFIIIFLFIALVIYGFVKNKSKDSKDSFQNHSINTNINNSIDTIYREEITELTEDDLVKFIEQDAYALAEKVNIDKSLLLLIWNPNYSVNFEEYDPLLKEAALIIVSAQQGSASLIQRKLKLGYNRACRIIDQLEHLKVVSQFDGSKARSVLFSSINELEIYLNPKVHKNYSNEKFILYKEKYYDLYKEVIELKANKILNDVIELKQKEELEQERLEIEQEKQKILNDLYFKERQKEIRRKAIAELTEEGHLEEQENKNSRHIPQQVKDQVWNRDKGMCVKCGSKNKLEFDHIIPYSEGGSNTYRNIQLLCENCNRTKSNKIG